MTFELFVPPRRPGSGSGNPNGRPGPRPLPPINHGTIGGFATHRRRGEVACDACRAARNADSLARYYAKKAARATALVTWHWQWLIGIPVAAVVAAIPTQTR